MEIFGISCDDAQDKDHWRLKNKREPVDPGLPGKWPLNGVCICENKVTITMSINEGIPVPISVLLVCLVINCI